MKRSHFFILIFVGVIAVAGVWGTRRYLQLTKWQAMEQFPVWAKSPIPSRLPLAKPYVANAEVKAKFLWEYDLSNYLAPKSSSDLDLVLRILKWSSGQILTDLKADSAPDSSPDHSVVSAETSNPLLLLNRAKKGEHFHDEELSEVTMAAVSAYGIPARVVELRRRDSESAESGAGHAVVEVWLRDLRKWVAADPQWGVVAKIGQVPLSLIELTAALKRHDRELKFTSVRGVRFASLRYPAWIAPFLYFLVYDVDQRIDLAFRGHDRVVLGPVGVEAPTLFERRLMPGRTYLTTDASEFERAPSQIFETH